jgi:hypothetical protein
VDGKPIEQAHSILLTAVGRVENLEMGWNGERTSVGNKWGSGPVQVEGIPARISLETTARKVTVHALDERGKRKGRVESRLEGGQLHFEIGPDHKSLWYEIETEGGK